MTQPHVNTAPDPSPVSALDDSFKKKADKLDKRIRTTVARIESDWVSLGEQFNEFSAGGYHTALGFPRLEDYIAEVIPEKSKTQVFQAMRIVRQVTGGESPIASKEQVRSMPRENAEGLAKIRAQGKPVTGEMVEKAQTLTNKQFKAQVLVPNTAPATALDGSPAEDHKQPIVLLRKTFTVTKETAEELDFCYKMGTMLCKDDDRDIPLEDKILQAICAEFRNSNEADYNALVAAEEAEAANRARDAVASLGPETVERTVELDEAEPNHDDD